MTHQDEPIRTPDSPDLSGGDAGPPDAADEALAQESPAWRWSPPAIFAFSLAGIVLPVICFLVSSGAKPEWQSGRLSAYAELLLSVRPAAAFFPLLIFCMVSMGLMLRDPQHASQRFWVRLGIYTGVALALQYFAILAVVLGDSLKLGVSFLLLSPIAALVMWLVAWALVARLRKPSTQAFAGVCTSIVAIALLVLLVALPPLFVVIPLLCATPWAMIAYGAMAWHLVQRRRAEGWQFSLAQLLGFVSWVALYCGAWRLSIKLMLIEYAKLPAEPPTGNCYVSTAAARGHRWLVGSETIAGGTLPVNDQMRYLKAAELALAATWPTVHRVCRACYDRLGPRMAAALVHPAMADMAYLILKPAEWTARLVLAAALGTEARLISRLYRD